MGWRRLVFVVIVLTQAMLLVGSVDRFDGSTGYVHVEDRVVPVHYLPPREYERAWNAYPELTGTVWYGAFTHGFTADGHIFLRQGPSLDERALIAHELGHILGYPHTLLPTTMNPWGIFRLQDSEGLVRLVHEAYVPPDEDATPAQPPLPCEDDCADLPDRVPEAPQEPPERNLIELPTGSIWTTRAHA